MVEGGPEESDGRPCAGVCLRNLTANLLVDGLQGVTGVSQLVESLVRAFSCQLHQCSADIARL